MERRSTRGRQSVDISASAPCSSSSTPAATMTSTNPTVVAPDAVPEVGVEEVVLNKRGIPARKTKRNRLYFDDDNLITADTSLRKSLSKSPVKKVKHEKDHKSKGASPASKGGRGESSKIVVKETARSSNSESVRGGGGDGSPLCITLKEMSVSMYLYPLVNEDKELRNVMAEDLCPVAVKRSKDAGIQPRTVAEANLALLESKRMCDVTFVFGSNVDNDRVQLQAHQLVLRARSVIFDLMFEACKSAEMKEIEIIVDDVNPDVFQAFLEFIYGEKFDVAMTDALDVLHLAKKYQVEPLIEKCEKLLRHEFQIQDAIQLYRKASKYGMPIWKEKACILMARKMAMLSNGSFFLKAEEDMMIELFGRDDLETDEIQLFQLALKWGKSRIKDDSDDDSDDDSVDDSDDNELKAVLAKILPLIRFPLMTTDQFATVVIPSKLLQLDDIVDICTFLAKNDENKDEGSLRFGTARRSQTGQFLSFYDVNYGLLQKIVVHDYPYVETYSFCARVQAAHLLSQPITSTPAITGVRLYLPQGRPKHGDALEFELCIMQFECDDMETHRVVNERQMFVESRLGVEEEYSLSVSVVPPLELVNGHYYGIVVKGDTCHPSAGRATYTWGSGSDLSKRDSSIKLRGQQSSIEIYDFKYPEFIASYKRSHHLDTLQIITGVKVVAP